MQLIKTHLIQNYNEHAQEVLGTVNIQTITRTSEHGNSVPGIPEVRP